MTESIVARDLVAVSGGVTLAGTVWLPYRESCAGVLMFPGSGPSDRHNGWFFPPIRDHLLGRGIAVASFDKRGVGGSGGDWLSVGLDALATDAIAEMEAFRAVDGVPIDRVGLFGHSQGGWIALEAAAVDGRAAFTVCNSGPGVGVAEQDRFAVRTAITHEARSASELEAALELYDERMRMLRSGRPWDDLVRRPEDPRLAAGWDLLERSGCSMPAADEWSHMGLIIDHDPAAAMRQIDGPVLAVFGAEDALVPVDPSVTVFERELGDRGLLTTRVFHGADHRMQISDPPGFAPGYLEAVADWVLEVACRRAGS